MWSLKVDCTLFVNACAAYHAFPLDCGAAKQNNEQRPRHGGQQHWRLPWERLTWAKPPRPDVSSRQKAYDAVAQAIDPSKFKGMVRRLTLF
jgi:hypothetical protein